MKAEVEHVDPELAELLLGRMIENRYIRRSKVTQFAADMKAGLWRLTGEAIKLTDDGQVIDGEHRLRAIIESGVSVETLVVRGARVDDRVAMDSGTSRTLSDHLRFLGLDRSTDLAAALISLQDRHSGTPRRGGVGGSLATSRQEFVLLFEANPRLLDSVEAVAKTARLLRLPRGLCAALHYDMVALDPDDADDFWARLHSGAEMHAQHPVLVLRRRLEENAATIGRKFDRLTIHAYIIKGWNAYRDGRDIVVIRWTRGGAHPEEFPTLQ